MKYYQELTILSDPECTPYFIWSKLYTQLHIALADVKNKHGIDSIGVAFPDYRYEQKQDKNSNPKTFATLGSKLRVFAPTEQALQTLNLNDWLERLTDYVHIKSIKAVPDTVTEHVLVKRYRHKSMHRLAKDYASYKGIDYDEAMAYCLEHKAEKDAGYPFINLTSKDNGNPFKLSIVQTVIDDGKQTKATFNTYGINNANGKSAVPHW